LWLLRLYASSEVAHARREETAGNRDLNRQLAATTARETFDNTSDDAHAKADSALAAYAYHYSNQVTGARAALADDPAIAFQRSVAARRAGHAKAAIGLLTPLKHRRAGDVWGDAARTEVWLGDRADRSPPRPTVTCRAATAPPQLDGVLDEPIWQDAASARLGDADPNAPHELGAAEVRLAYDKEFLYLAVMCQKVAGVAYPHDEAPRPRDGDMANFDHVRLRLDLDRDYATCFELTLDSRGWTADACWGSAVWNPQWYVAAAEGEDAGGGAWIVEAAIPWSELSRSKPTSGDAWACAIDRFAPGAGGQTWAGSPGDALAPQSFGLLLFD
jgi:hypothetical protein